MTDLAKTPSFRLDGRRALVTGGGRGIGLAAASALAAAGAHVTLAARTKAEIEDAASAIRARGEKADALVLDVTDVEAARKAITAAKPFQILINNAGMNRPANLPDVKVEDFDAIFALNVRAAFFMAQAVAVRLIAAKLPGSIVNISSQMGHVGAARRTVYCASKHAMEGFTKAMAIELAPHNIRVNSLGPTFLETPMTKPFFENKAFRDEVLAKIKLGRLGQLDELSGAIVFLASDASSLMTGSALVLDGTWTLVSVVYEDVASKERTPVYGEHPRGIQIATPEGRWLALMTAEGRAIPKTDGDRAQALKSMIAYTGRYRVENGQVITKVEAAWNEAWVGGEQVRNIRFEGDRLYIESPPMPHPNINDKTVRVIVVWQREKN